MSVTSKNPLRFAGAVFNSGSINTGEQNMTFGGLVAATVFSGIASGVSLAAAPGAVAFGSDILFWSGAGRLKDVAIGTVFASGSTVKFYDSAAPASGGPASGVKHLFDIVNSVLSGAVGLAPGTVLAADIPFTSGLACNLTQNPGTFTVTFTPEPSPALVNPG